MTTQILLAGFGGQGILFAGKFLAYAALLEGREITWLPSYGPEMRGGTANCSVIFSDTAVGSPIVLTPDILIAMNLPSFLKYEPAVTPGGLLFADASLIAQKSERTDIRCHYVPATGLAGEQKLDGLANMILLGAALKETDLIKQDTIEAALKKTIPPRKAQLYDANVRALQLGANVRPAQ
jgi:2-oxoglutarate ferredoxin oxidoreductase subunit gamma